jgi:hypothetical protein
MFDRSPPHYSLHRAPKRAARTLYFLLQRPIAYQTGHGIVHRLRYYLTRLYFALRRVSPDPAIPPMASQAATGTLNLDALIQVRTLA